MGEKVVNLCPSQTDTLKMVKEESATRQSTAANSVGSEELRKPHEMIVMMPRSGRITLTGRRVYNALLHVSQAQMRVMNEMPPADFLFRAPLAFLLRATGSSGEQRTAAKKYLKEMRGLEVDWESTAAGDGMKWKGFSMLSEVILEECRGENWVSWSYPPTLMSALREPTRWAKLDLEILGKLGTYTALALYEICARYRDNPSGLTSRKPVSWWADALSNTPSGSDRREWRKFKNEKLNAAIEEVNRETEIDIELIEHKQGRAVEEAQFSVRKKHRVPVAKKTEVVDLDLIQKALQLGIREIKLDPLLQEYGDDAVRMALNHLESRTASKQYRPIENTHSYLRTVLRSGGVTPVSDSISDGPLGSDVAPQLLRANIGRPASNKVTTPDSSEEVQRLQKIRSELEAMSTETRQVFVNQAVVKLIEKGLFTPVIRRRFEQGDDLHGVLGAMVIKCFDESKLREKENVEH